MPFSSYLGACLWQRRWCIGLALAVLLGIVFRLAWINDIEYKSDEAQTFAITESYFTTHEWPTVGIMSSQGLPNSGLSLWQMTAIEAFVPADPQSVTRAIEVINCASLLLLALFIWRCVDAREKEAWGWGLALISVNPLAVLFSRKIWELDLFPPYVLGVLLGWWYRDRWWGALLWGFTGALLGQVHLGGFYYAAAFFLVTLYYGRRDTNWTAWFAGSVLGALPMLPWLAVVFTTHPHVTPPSLSNLNPLIFAHWLGYASALELAYSLGRDFWNFLAGPVIGGVPTYMAALVHVVLLALECMIFVRLYKRWSAEARALLFSPQSKTALVLLAAFLVHGLIVIASLHESYLHYLAITFPLPVLSLVWLDRAASSRHGVITQSRGLLTAIVIGQAILTLLFLLYVHQAAHIDGDYGTPWHAQIHTAS